MWKNLDMKLASRDSLGRMRSHRRTAVWLSMSSFSLLSNVALHVPSFWGPVLTVSLTHMPSCSLLFLAPFLLLFLLKMFLITTSTFPPAGMLSSSHSIITGFRLCWKSTFLNYSIRSRWKGIDFFFLCNCLVRLLFLVFKEINPTNKQYWGTCVSAIDGLGEGIPSTHRDSFYLASSELLTSPWGAHLFLDLKPHMSPKYPSPKGLL